MLNKMTKTETDNILILLKTEKQLTDNLIELTLSYMAEIPKNDNEYYITLLSIKNRLIRDSKSLDHSIKFYDAIMEEL